VQLERLDSYEAVVEAMCATPAETIGFLPAMGYVLGHELCDVQAGATALQFDLPWQMGMIVARADSGITSLEDLADKRWAKPAPLSITRDLFFQAQLAEAGIEPAEVVEYDSENSALLAVFDGEADFATATYLPPILPYDERPWVYGEDEPEIWRQLGIAPERLPVGYIVVIADPEDGGYRIRDARASLFDIQPEIFRQTRIIGVSEPLPNTSVVFGSEFPLALALKLQESLVAFAGSASCAESLCSNDFYGWDGAALTDDQAYNPLRFVQEHLELSAEQLWDTLGQ
jgi:phosphonate transport system substrate-binding protein